MSILRYFNWNHKNKTISFIDQSLLPLQEKIRTFKDYRELANAIRHLVVRGAPAIGIAGGYGVAIASYHEKADNIQELRNMLSHVIEDLSQTRPTAVNLFWALKRISNIVNDEEIISIDEMREEITDEAIKIDNEEFELGVKLGKIGSEIIPANCIALTHCNAGGLATSGMGSALSVFFYAREAGKNIKVYVDETRPLLQGGRLTTYELMKWGIDCELICDNMAGMVMNTKKVDVIITGCDRVASNGDTANKIGTYSLSVLSKYHNIPMYIACPISTIDFELKSGDEIPIEERNADEVTSFRSERIAPFNTAVYNPAFDITPAENISGFITEEGIITPPYKENLKKLKIIWQKRKERFK